MNNCVVPTRIGFGVAIYYINYYYYYWEQKSSLKYVVTLAANLELEKHIKLYILTRLSLYEPVSIFDYLR